jgi:pimeloyl-ACP methyl ester carboxylesterase
MIECAVEAEVVVVEAPQPGYIGAGLERFGLPVWSIRERFQAITGIGLSAGSGPLPRRHVRDADDPGMPSMSFLASGAAGGRRIVFVHGTPGDGSDWAPFLRDAPQDQYRIAVDRPGFGESGPGAPVVSLAEQARAIAPLLGAPEDPPAIVVGSSFGGPVALRLAADHGDAVAGVLLVGSAADPGQEKTHPVQPLVAREPLASLLPEPLAHSNAELLALRDELDALADVMGAITAPVTMVQGLRDTLVPPGNVDFLLERLTGAASRRVFLVPEAGHFLQILHAPIVERALACLLDDADAALRAGMAHAAE